MLRFGNKVGFHGVPPPLHLVDKILLPFDRGGVAGIV
jgi:hypothetical protein